MWGVAAYRLRPAFVCEWLLCVSRRLNVSKISARNLQVDYSCCCFNCSHILSVRRWSIHLSGR